MRKMHRYGLITGLMWMVVAALPAFGAPFTVVDTNSPMVYIEPLGDLPNSGNPVGWTAKVYDLSQDNGKGDTGNGNLTGNWQAGAYGVGYGDDDDSTLIDSDGSVYSVYTRTAFSVANASQIKAMTLEVDYDDGYIAWLNGVEISRSGSMSGRPAQWNTASGDHEAAGSLGVPLDLSALVSLLVNGENTLAIGVWNSSPGSSDLTLIPRLKLYDTPYSPPPLHVYLTWQGDTSTTMTVNYQTGAVAGNSRVYYDTVPRGGNPAAYRYQKTGASHKIPGLDAYVQRNVHWVPLTGLTPGQTYYFVAGDPAVAVSQELKFQTIPGGNAAIRFVVGGDMSVIPAVAQLHRQAALRSPMFALMTGDLAIDNGLLSNWALWDTWLSQWEENMVTPDGRMIPMVLGMGNHEVDGAFDQTPDKAPFYFGYFAQSAPKGYFSRRFGQNMALLVMNSGHVAPVDGEQATWISGELTAASAVPNRFAAYHVPVYPSERPLSDSGVAAVRGSWRPLFDQFQITAAFEGHDHTSKRTKLLRNNLPDPNGTLYLGDGYGTQGLRPGAQQGAWYLERVESRYHFWLVEVPRAGVPGATPTYTAIDEKGTAFDTFRKQGNAAIPAALVPAGSVWKYLDDGSDQGTAWRAADFNDSAWASGPAELGYGDGGEATVVGYGPDAGNKYITTYFRKSFNVANPAAYGLLRVRLKRDDGAVVYLNGVELHRSNMSATSSISYTSTASTAVAGDDESAFYLSPDLPNLLNAGSNVLAVEIHQSSATSSDLSFDLELLGVPPGGTSLSARGAVWKFLDNGSDQGTAWRAPGFNDSAWASGPAQLGYGDGDEATVLGYGADANNKHITTYLRRTFNVPDKSRFRNYYLRVCRDDGVIVYLNGAEVFRSNMPNGPCSYTTTASAAVANGPDESTFYPSPLLNSALVDGVNTLAVELHQSAATSSDLSFDLELVGVTGLNTITASANSGGSISPSGLVTLEDGQSQTYSFTAVDGHRLKSILVDGAPVALSPAYTFNKITADHSIQAVFESTALAVAGQPPSQIRLREGEDRVLAVTISGGIGEVHYTWYREIGGGGPVQVGLDAPTLELFDVRAGDSGRYYCVIRDDVLEVSTDKTTVSVVQGLPVGSMWSYMVLACMLAAVAVVRTRRKPA